MRIKNYETVCSSTQPLYLLSLFSYLKILSLMSLFYLQTGLFASVVVQDEMTKVFTLARGENASGSVLLYNPSNVAVNVSVFSADYIYTETGEHFYLEAGKYYRSNADFVRFAGSHTIPANQSYQLPFTVSIPQRPDLNGSYWSVMFIQPLRANDFSSQHPDEWTINHRYAIQIVSNIKNTGNIDLSFGDIHFIENAIEVSLTNSGTLWVDTTIKIDIFDDKASLIGSFVKEKNRIYPELLRRIDIPVNLPMSGNYYAIIIADCGEGQIFGHQISFNIK